MSAAKTRLMVVAVTFVTEAISNKVVSLNFSPENSLV